MPPLEEAEPEPVAGVGPPWRDAEDDGEEAPAIVVALAPARMEPGDVEVVESPSVDEVCDPAPTPKVPGFAPETAAPWCEDEHPDVARAAAVATANTHERRRSGLADRSIYSYLFNSDSWATC